MLAHEGLGGLLLVFEKDQRLLLPIRLKKLCVDDGTILFQMVHNILLRHILGEGGQVDHLGWGTAVAIVLGCIAIEAIEIRARVFMGVRSSCDVSVLRKIHLQVLAEQDRTL